MIDNTHIEKLSMLITDIHDKDIFIAIAKGTIDDEILVAIGDSNNKETRQVMSFLLTGNSVCDMIDGIDDLRKDMLTEIDEKNKASKQPTVA